MLKINKSGPLTYCPGTNREVSQGIGTDCCSSACSWLPSPCSLVPVSLTLHPIQFSERQRANLVDATPHSSTPMMPWSSISQSGAVSDLARRA